MERPGLEMGHTNCNEATHETSVASPHQPAYHLGWGLLLGAFAWLQVDDPDSIPWVLCYGSISSYHLFLAAMERGQTPSTFSVPFLLLPTLMLFYSLLELLRTPHLSLSNEVVRETLGILFALLSFAPALGGPALPLVYLALGSWLFLKLPCTALCSIK